MDRHPSPPAPLPGFQRRPRGLFVDRWGTLLEKPSDGPCTRASELAWVPGAVDALFRAHRAGWHVYLLGNEEDVAFGRQSESSWNEVRDAIEGHLGDHGIVVRRHYASIDHPDGVQGRTQDSVFHLPNTGAFYQAAHTDGIELRESWVIGDETLELVAGWRAGLRLAGVRTGTALRDATWDVDPEIVAASLPEAVSALLDAENALRI